MRFQPVFIVLFLFFTLTALAQETEQALFNQGLKAYKAGNYEQAQNYFLKILQQFPGGKLTTATKLMLARAYYKQGDYNAVKIIAQNFFKKHAESNYLDDMHHILGNTYFKTGKYTEAIEEWLWVLSNSRDPRLKKIDGEYIFKTMDAFLSEKEIRDLEERHAEDTFTGLVTVLRAKKLMEKGESSRAERLLTDFLNQYPNHFYADEARKLLAKKKITQPGGFVYFKPSRGDLVEVARQVEMGMRYAIREYQRRHNDTYINFQTVEHEGTVLSVISEGLRVIRENDPICWIGPIESDNCAALALLSRYENRPYIIPLSSQTGLTEISPFAFQLNPDVETKGRFLGEYATAELNLKRVAILAPANDYGENFVQSFVEAVQANGGEIVSEQWYYEDAQDFTRQFKAIRKKAFYITFMDSISQVDSSFTEEELKEKFSEWMERRFKSPLQTASIDSTQIPATGIDGLLIVTTPQYIPFIAPQFAFHNIQTTLLGNEGWNDPEQLKQFKDYVNGMIYITAGYIDQESWNYKEFQNRFRMEMNETPLLYHMLGYDIMKWILSNYESDMKPADLRERLEKTNKYEGILENIRFGDKPRVNDQLTVLKFEYGHLIKLR